MTDASLDLRTEDCPNGCQRSLRRRTRHLSLRRAVRYAARAFFRFKYRGATASALWSSAEHVWMGRETFLHWALCDRAIDIPWIVALAEDAPSDPEELREAVGAELAAYWKKQLASLPRKGKPHWLPLP
jgi:hypothetical protein